MQTQGVQEGGQSFHEDQHSDGEAGPEHEDEDQYEGPAQVLGSEANPQHHAPQHFRQLCTQHTVNCELAVHTTQYAAYT